MLHEIDLSRADLNLLVLFETIFEEAHVGRAAGRLNLSPSAVSHGLGRLRKLLNDPVFLRTPKGVVPSDRARELAPAISEVLQKIRSIVARSEAFDPASSARRLVIGAPDGVSAVFLHTLMHDLAQQAPGIDIGIRQLLPVAGETLPERAWTSTFADLDARAVDIAVIPSEEAPGRFARRTIYEEDFVLAMRRDHPFLAKQSVAGYCAASHLVVSLTGDPRGFVDEVLAREGLARRVALTVPNFMFAAAILPDTDLLCAIPRRFAAAYGHRLQIQTAEPPLPLGTFRLNAYLPKIALADAGVTWLLELLANAGRA